MGMRGVRAWTRASRQTGRTVLFAKLIELFARLDSKERLAGGRRVAFEAGRSLRHESQPEPVVGDQGVIAYPASESVFRGFHRTE
jgi:hypothetical protein